MEAILDAIYRVMDTVLPFEWLQRTYMKRALLAVLLITPTCAAMGVPVIGFRMVFFSSAISHSVFAGVALGLVIGLDPRLSIFSMVVFGVIIAAGITHVRRRSELSNDTVIGVFFSFTVALGIAIISARPEVTRNLHAMIFGDIITISGSEILLFFSIFILTFTFLAWSYNHLILKGINERLASTQGVMTRYYDYAFAALLAMVVTSSVRVVGLLLVTAMLVVPAGAGRNIARNARQAFWLTMFIGTFSGIAGLMLSYYWGSSAGATIILVAALIFMLTQYLPRIFRKFLAS